MKVCNPIFFMKDTLHLRAPGNWINDPNGFIYYKGKYHLFYQCFPFAPEWGTMHWGHAISTDLIHWEHLGIALYPTKKYDQNGIFSGTAIEVDGKMYLYYTAVRYGDHIPGNIHIPKDDFYKSSQAMIISDDGFTFDNKDGKKKIISVHDDKKGHVTHTKDPNVWKDGNTYYMLLGSTKKRKVGRLVFYKSKDAKHWEYANTVTNKQFGKIMECPDIFKINDTYVLQGSAMYINQEAGAYEHHAMWQIVDFNKKTCDVKLLSKEQPIDYGGDFYAPQTILDKKGRRIMIGWMRMPEALKSDDRAPWNGMMTLPRVIEVKKGKVSYHIHPEVNKFLSEQIYDKEKLPEMYRIKVKLKEGESINIGGFIICMKNQKIVSDRSKVFGNYDNIQRISQTPKVGKSCKLDIIVNKNIIEIYVNDGEYVISNVVYGWKNKIDGKVDEIFTAKEAGK